MGKVSETANNLLETERVLIASFEDGTSEDRVEALRGYSVALIEHHNAVEESKRDACGKPE